MNYREVARVSEEVLAVCDREPIHIPESIQPHGALIVVDLNTWQIDRVSENIDEFLRRSTRELLGFLFLQIFAEQHQKQIHLILEQLRATIAEEGLSNDRVVLAFPEPLAHFVCECHLLDDRWWVIELEKRQPKSPAGERWDELRLLRYCSRALDEEVDLAVTLNHIGKMIRDLIGYDRVMFYRMDEEGHGQVIAEDKRDNLEPFLGLHFPASDIPFQARRLYVKNRVRQLCNVNYAPVGLIRADQDHCSTPLDMSLCHLRSISPVHVEYLQNMGVSATLVISIVIENRLWGLIACHNYEPRHLDAKIRQQCEKLAHHVTNNIRAIEHRRALRMFEQSRQLPGKLLSLVGTGSDWHAKFLASGFYLLSQMNANGLAIYEDGIYHTAGLVPEPAVIEKIRRLLNDKRVLGSYGCNSLKLESETIRDVAAEHAGCLLVDVCDKPQIQMLWFRKERRQTATWAGNPTVKSQSFDGKDVRLSPRKSFEKWTQIVEGYCHPWEPLDLARAELIGQFVATRTMEQMSRQHDLSQRSVTVGALWTRAFNETAPNETQRQ